MRSTKVLVGGLFALLLAACSGADAGQSQQASLGTASNQVQESAHHDPARFLQHFDKNGDGKVQVSELPAKMQERLGKADTNGDGVISPEEMQARFAEMKKERFAKADKNGDGALDATEVGARRWTFMQAADANKDGKVTPAEMDQARASGVLKQQAKARFAQMKKERFAKADKNGDGALDATEVGARRWARIQVADADKDGKVTSAELDQARTSGLIKHEHRARWHGAEGAKGGEKGPRARWHGGDGEHAGKGEHARHARSPEQIIARFDANKDGILQTSEMPDRMRTRLERADTNKDGAVTKEELTAFHAQMKAARDARHAAGPSGASGAPGAAETAPAPGANVVK